MPSGNLKQRFPLQSRLQANQSKKHPKKSDLSHCRADRFFCKIPCSFITQIQLLTPDNRLLQNGKRISTDGKTGLPNRKEKKAAISQAESKTLKIQRIMSYAMPLDTSSRSDTSAFSPLLAQLFPFKSTKRIRILWVQDSPP